MVADVLAAGLPSERAGAAQEVARTLLSTAAGGKYEVDTREEFIARLTVAVDLFLAAPRGRETATESG